MNILIAHLGTPSECLISTSVLKGLKDSYGHPSIYIIVQDERCSDIFKYNRSIKDTYDANHVPSELTKINFDLLINLHPAFNEEDASHFRAKEKCGFWFSVQHKFFTECAYGDRESKVSMFQMYYNLMGMKWKGQGYDFHYRPQTSTSRLRTGLALANSNLSKYVSQNLSIDTGKLWTIHLKDNVFKRSDEINRCSTVITDDFLTMNLAVFLRKKVHFLKTVSYGMRIEHFGRGQIYEVPNNILL